MKRMHPTFRIVVILIAMFGILAPGAARLQATQMATSTSRSFSPQTSGEPQAAGDTRYLHATLAGGNEVPPTNSSITATAVLTYTLSTNTLDYWIYFPYPVSATGSHIHRGAAGANGPIAYSLGPIDGLGIAGSVTLTEPDEQLLFNEGLYINIHTSSYPSGEIRGQIEEVGQASADLAIAFSGVPGAVNAGENVDYIVFIANNGPAAATGVTVSNPIPPGAAFVSSGCPLSGSTVTCAIGTLGAGQAFSTTITLRALSAGQLTNTASVTGAQADPDTSNNTASATTTVAGATYTISGLVRSQGGVPVPGVVVSASGRSATTNTAGAYTLTGLPAGTYTLRPAKRGYSFAPPALTISVPPNAGAQHFTAGARPIYLPLMLRPAPDRCDAYEPNDDRANNPSGPIGSGQTVQAKICAGDLEDNYYFVTATGNQVQIKLLLPSSLVGHTSLWVYHRDDVRQNQEICKAGTITRSDYTMLCSIPRAGPYVIRLYTDDGVFDNINPYSLRAIYN
jgi:uncharacterized repeat protein (TIGR01451 family)